MIRQARPVANYFHSLVNLRAVILGLALLHLILMQIWVSRWYQRFGDEPGDSYPDSFLKVSFLLVFASLTLLLGKWWSQLLALLVSSWVLYSLGFAALHSVALAHDLPLLSFSTARLWLIQKYTGQPQELLQLALAFIILGYVITSFVRYRRSVNALRAVSG